MAEHEALNELSDYRLLKTLISTDNQEAPADYQRLSFAYYQRYRQFVVKKLIGMGVDDEAAQDLTQEAFERLFKNAKVLAWRTEAGRQLNVPGYLSVTARRLALDHFRRLSKERYVSLDELDEEDEDSADLGMCVDDEERMNEILDRLRDNNFSEKSVTIFKAVWVLQITHKEAAEKFGVAVHHIRQLIDAAKPVMREIFSEL